MMRRTSTVDHNLGRLGQGIPGRMRSLVAVGISLIWEWRVVEKGSQEVFRRKDRIGFLTTRRRIEAQRRGLVEVEDLFPRHRL